MENQNNIQNQGNMQKANNMQNQGNMQNQNNMQNQGNIQNQNNMQNQGNIQNQNNIKNQGNLMNNNNSTQNIKHDDGGFLWGLLGFLMPTIGAVLFIVWNEEKPKTAKAAGLGALLLIPAIFILYFLLAFLAPLSTL